MGKKIACKISTIMLILVVMLSGLCTGLCNDSGNISGTLEKAYADIEEPLVQNTYIENWSNKSGINIPDEVKQLLIEYYDTYYESSANLEKRDLAHFFSEKYYENAAINQTALDLLVEGRLMLPQNMRMTDVSYGLKVISAKKVSDKKYTLTIRDSCKMHFAFMSDIESQILNVKSTFIVIKVNDEWKLKSAKRVQSFYSTVEGAYNKYKLEEPTQEEINQALSEIREKKLIEYAAKNEQNELLLSEANSKDLEEVTCDHKYKRKKAVAFAQSHVTTRTKPDYSNYGGNCQNYASWMLRAGGIPMDWKGKYQWKHYGAYNNYNNTKKGRTASFIVVSSFYKYAKYNRGYGLRASVDVNPYYGEGGDVLQIGKGDYFSHTTVVVGSEKDEEGNIKDILLNSNTMDFINCPMCIYSYSDVRLIKIWGWND